MIGIALLIIFAAAPAAVFAFVKQSGDFQACMSAGATAGCIAACALIVCRGLASGGVKLKVNAACVFGALFVTLSFISAAVSGHPGASFRGASEALVFWVVFYLLFSYSESGRPSRLLWPAPVFSCIFCIIALLQYYGIDMLPEKSRYAYDLSRAFRAYSFFGNPNLFADYIAIALPVCIGAAAFAKHRAYKAAGYLSTALSIACLFAAGSRGALFGASAGAGVMAALLLVSRAKKSALPSAALVAVLACTVAVAAATSHSAYKKESVKQRLMTWSIAWSMFTEHPVAGVGPDNFGREYLKYQASYFKKHDDPVELSISSNEKQRHAHNDFLQTAAEVGAPGAIALAAFAVALAAGLVRHIMSRGSGAGAAAAILGSIAALCVAGSFSFPMRVPPTAALLAVLAACAAAVPNAGAGRTFVFPSGNFLSSVRVRIEAIGLVLLFSFYAVLSLSAEPLYSDILVKSGQRELVAGNGFRAQPLCSRALIADRLNGDAAYCMGTADLLNGEYDEAEYFLEMSLRTIDDPLIHYSLGLAHLKMKRYGDAAREFDVMRAMAPAYTGRLLEIAEAYKSENLPDDAVKYYRIAVPLFLEELKRAPDANTHLKLAECYHGLGDPQRYELHLREALKLRPYDKRIKSAIQAIQRNGAAVPR